jgi:hypothetical protein
MAKRSGIGASFFVDEIDLSGDVGAITSAETMRNEQDVTGINKSAVERILTLRDGTMSFASFWNTATDQAVLTLQTMPRTDRICTLMLSSSLGDAAASIQGKQINYPITRAQDGSLAATNDVKANGLGMGLEWGEMLTTGKETFASGTLDTTAIDLGAVSTLFGMAAYLHVFSLGSGEPTVTVQDSANNIAFAAITGGAFTSVTAATSERIQTSATATIRRYVRIEVDGTYTDLVAAVNFVRYTESVVA